MKPPLWDALPGYRRPRYHGPWPTPLTPQTADMHLPQLSATANLSALRHFAAKGAMSFSWLASPVPHAKMPALSFAATQLCPPALGAARSGWFAPYLPYMRQDRVFRRARGRSHPCNLRNWSHPARIGVASTIDPHLHAGTPYQDIY